MEVNIHHAKTNLSKLIAAAESGEEVIIARAGKPAVQLVIVAQKATRSRKKMLGAGVGKIWMADDIDSAATEIEVERLFQGDGAGAPQAAWFLRRLHPRGDGGIRNGTTSGAV